MINNTYFAVQMSDVVDTLFLKEFYENNDLKSSKALKLVLILL